MAAPNEKVVSTLNRLIEICKDAEMGFQTAAKDVKDSEFGALCLQYSRQRAQFAEELQQAVRQVGGDPAASGSVTGALHRGWMNIKSAVEDGDEDAVINECERGEEAAKEAYEKALAAFLPLPVTGIVQRQYAEIKAAHNRFSALQKAAR